ncbi:MAG: hypothetical protein WA962_05885, partial [Ornithinimicrobium sp.]
MFDNEPVYVSRFAVVAVGDGAAGDRATGFSWRPPGEVLTGHVTDGARCVVLAATVAPVLPRLSGDEVIAGLEEIDVLRARTET